MLKSVAVELRYMHRIDESYPLKSTLLYLGVAVAIDVLALALASLALVRRLLPEGLSLYALTTCRQSRRLPRQL